LVLYFNDAQGAFGDNSNSFMNVTINGLGTTNVPAYANELNSGFSPGVAIGTVIKGSNYTFSASGFCARNFLNQLTDADGRDPNSNQVACSSINITNTICPTAHCFSLVGMTCPRWLDNLVES
jgi:hypothetical protein